MILPRQASALSTQPSMWLRWKVQNQAIVIGMHHLLVDKACEDGLNYWFGLDMWRCGHHSGVLPSIFTVLLRQVPSKGMVQDDAKISRKPNSGRKTGMVCSEVLVPPG